MGFKEVVVMKYMKGNLNLGDAAALAISFVVFVVVLGAGAQALTGIQSAQTANSTAYNITGQGLTGFWNLGNYSSTIGTILGAAIIISIVVGAFYLGMKRE